PSPRLYHSFPTRRSSDLGFLAVARAALEYDVDVILRGRVDRDFSRRLSFLTGLVESLFRIKIRDLLAVLKQTHGRLLRAVVRRVDRKSTRLNSSHLGISY